MHHKFLGFMAAFILLLILGACAPADLDFTPTPIPTEIPTATPTIDAQAAAQPSAEATEIVSTERAALDMLIAAIPGRINAGAIQWNRTRDPVFYQEVANGVTGRLAFSEAGGGASEITFGIFATPDDALAYYNEVLGRLRTLENAETRDNFSLPNAFGGGTYGSDAIFARDVLFVRVSVPRFSSTAGNPLIGYSRELFRIIDTVMPPPA